MDRTVLSDDDDDVFYDANDTLSSLGKQALSPHSDLSGNFSFDTPGKRSQSAGSHGKNESSHETGIQNSGSVNAAKKPINVHEPSPPIEKVGNETPHFQKRMGSLHQLETIVENKFKPVVSDEKEEVIPSENTAIPDALTPKVGEPQITYSSPGYKSLKRSTSKLEPNVDTNKRHVGNNADNSIEASGRESEHEIQEESKISDSVKSKKGDQHIYGADEFVVKNLDTGESVSVRTAELDESQGLDPITQRMGMILPRDSTDGGEKQESSKKSRRWKWFGTSSSGLSDDNKKDEEESDGEYDDANIQKVGYHKVKKRDFEGLYFVQELREHQPLPTWVMKFNMSGQYLATAGADAVIRIWEVYTPRPSSVDEVFSNAEADVDYSEIVEKSGKHGKHRRNISLEKRLRAPIFKPEPIREFRGHEGDILDLVWSKNDFVLSASMDRVVRMWHISRPDAMAVFPHKDFVTSVAFHPQDDRFFLSGSLDGYLRIWNILKEKIVAYAELTPRMITAAAFSMDGRIAFAGCIDGICTMYEVCPDKLRFITTIAVRSSRGKNAKESKITGIKPLPSGGQILCTSNDSRIRLYNITHDTSLFCKYRGHDNQQGQIKAHFSHDGKYIICGSEDYRVYIWKTETDYVPSINPRLTRFRKDRSASYEYFNPTRENLIVTDAIFAPPSTIRLLLDVDSETEVDDRHIVIAGMYDGQIRVFAKNMLSKSDL